MYRAGECVRLRGTSGKWQTNSREAKMQSPSEKTADADSIVNNVTNWTAKTIKKKLPRQQQ